MVAASFMGECRILYRAMRTRSDSPQMNSRSPKKKLTVVDARRSGVRRDDERPADATPADARPADERRARVVRCIQSLPKGKVSSYGEIARAAGWPRAARQVVRILQQVKGLPWHRVVGYGGSVKLQGENAAEQKFRLQMEGVEFRGARVNMAKHEHKFKLSHKKRK